MPSKNSASIGPDYRCLGRHSIPCTTGRRMRSRLGPPAPLREGMAKARAKGRLKGKTETPTHSKQINHRALPQPRRRREPGRPRRRIRRRPFHHPPHHQQHHPAPDPTLAPVATSDDHGGRQTGQPPTGDRDVELTVSREIRATKQPSTATPQSHRPLWHRAYCRPRGTNRCAFAAARFPRTTSPVGWHG